MVSHISLGAVKQSLELQPICVSIGDHVPDLADDRREYEDADQVADYREDVPTDQEARKRADQSKEGVISVLGSWTSGPRRSLSPLSLSLSFSLSFSLFFLVSLSSYISSRSFVLTCTSFSLSFVPFLSSLSRSACSNHCAVCPFRSFTPLILTRSHNTWHATFHAQKNAGTRRDRNVTFMIREIWIFRGSLHLLLGDSSLNRDVTVSERHSAFVRRTFVVRIVHFMKYSRGLGWIWILLSFHAYNIDVRFGNSKFIGPFSVSNRVIHNVTWAMVSIRLTCLLSWRNLVCEIYNRIAGA